MCDWIPVSERLPPADHAGYLLMCVRLPGREPQVRVGLWIARRQEWRYEGLVRLDERAEVTHWMPWPAPPEEG